MDATAWARTHTSAPTRPKQPAPVALSLDDPPSARPQERWLQSATEDTGMERASQWRSLLASDTAWPWALKRAGLSVGLAAIGLAVGVPYVPGITDNLLVGALAGAAPFLAKFPCGGSSLASCSALSDGDANATAASDGVVLKAWLPPWMTSSFRI
mmetsp:Transcript_19799/g.46438  ORF Transcript_19799/g.46438 Transcript_19799/m.46438 type:complete len:156 (+) Transcript_19799:400-867(+)